MNLVAKPEIKVSFFNTTINGEVYNHNVTLAQLLDSEGDDVTGVEQIPLVGTRIKTLGFTTDRGETIFYETIINANVRSISPGLRKFVNFTIRTIRYISGLFLVYSEAKKILKDQNDPIHLAIVEFNKEIMENNPVLQAIDKTDEKEMFNNLDIIGKLIINGQNYLLLRIKFKTYSLLFFDISKPFNI